MSPQEQAPVRLERRGSVAILIIDRPARANALSRATLLALGRAGRQLADEAAVRAIVITGAGDKAFCAGADLKERRDMSLDDTRRQVGLYRSELGVLDRSQSAGQAHLGPALSAAPQRAHHGPTDEPAGNQLNQVQSPAALQASPPTRRTTYTERASTTWTRSIDGPLGMDQF